MPTYQPNIPTGTVDLDKDYLNLQGNFQQLNIAYGVDHVPFSDTSGTFPSGITGIHQSVHLNPVSTTTTNPPNNQPVVAPATTAGFGQVFSSEINDGINVDTALYFLTGGGRLQQLTRNFAPVAAQNGYTFLPGGFILQWAQFTVATGSGTRNFATAGNIAFPNNCFIVILQGDDNTSATQNLLVTSRSATAFGFKNLNTGGTLYTYLALGN